MAHISMHDIKSITVVSYNICQSKLVGTYYSLELEIKTAKGFEYITFFSEHSFDTKADINDLKFKMCDKAEYKLYNE